MSALSYMSSPQSSDTSITVTTSATISESRRSTQPLIAAVTASLPSSVNASASPARPVASPASPIVFTRPEGLADTMLSTTHSRFSADSGSDSREMSDLTAERSRSSSLLVAAMSSSVELVAASLLVAAMSSSVELVAASLLVAAMSSSVELVAASLLVAAMSSSVELVAASLLVAAMSSSVELVAASLSVAAMSSSVELVAASLAVSSVALSSWGEPQDDSATTAAAAHIRAKNCRERFALDLATPVLGCAAAAAVATAKMHKAKNPAPNEVTAIVGWSGIMAVVLPARGYSAAHPSVGTLSRPVWPCLWLLSTRLRLGDGHQRSPTTRFAPLFSSHPEMPSTCASAISANAQQANAATPPWPALPDVAATSSSQCSKPAPHFQGIASTSNSPGRGGRVVGDAPAGGSTRIACQHDQHRRRGVGVVRGGDTDPSVCVGRQHSQRVGRAVGMSSHVNADGVDVIGGEAAQHRRRACRAAGGLAAQALLGEPRYQSHL